MAIPAGITCEHVLEAMRRYDAGERGDFGEPTGYIVAYEFLESFGCGCIWEAETGKFRRAGATT